MWIERAYRILKNWPAHICGYGQPTYCGRCYALAEIDAWERTGVLADKSKVSPG